MRNYLTAFFKQLQGFAIMKPHNLAWLAAFVTTASLATSTTSLDAALKKVAVLDGQMKFAEIVDTLRPFAQSENGEVELSLADAYMSLAINGKGPQTPSPAALKAMSGIQPATIDPQEIQLAVTFAERAARHGKAGGYNLLYVIYGNGYGLKADTPKALNYLKLAADGGDWGAKFNLAVMVYEGRPFMKKDIGRACGLFHELLDKSPLQREAAYYVGQMVYFGQCGRAPDRGEGMKLVAIAANGGMRSAERDMGKSFEHGWLGHVDKAKALSWYQKAAEHGDAFSQWRIGMAYVYGELGEPKDSAEGVRYLQRAAASDYPDGLTDLAVMYVEGDGVAKDLAGAMLLYQRAAELGEPHAYREMAVMYANGEGVAVDRVRARALYLESVAMGDEKSDLMDKAFSRQLTRAQIEQSDRDVAAWQGTHPAGQAVAGEQKSSR